MHGIAYGHGIESVGNHLNNAKLSIKKLFYAIEESPLMQKCVEISDFDTFSSLLEFADIISGL